MINLIHGDCLEKMKDIPDGSVDLVLTSPPYDNLRTYNGNLQWSFDIFKDIAQHIRRVLIKGGVIVWVVGDATVKGSETGTSFRQALYFMELGLNLHDTMIYAKNPTPYDPKCMRYWQEFEYMFVLSKGKPTYCNYIKEPCKGAGKLKIGDYGQKRPDGSNRTDRHNYNRIIKNTKPRGNIWFYTPGNRVKGHPAQYPYQLAEDHVVSWTEETGIVLDPFMGSGTTGVACINTNRKFIGIEKEEKYFELAKERIEEVRGGKK